MTSGTMWASSPTIQKRRAEALLFPLFQSFFQGRGCQGRQMHPAETVFAGEHEGLGQIVTGNHLALLFRLLQKFPGAAGGRGVVQVENADDALLPDCHIIADGKIHEYAPFVGEGLDPP